jgi:Fe-S-cluster containining protein
MEALWKQHVVEASARAEVREAVANLYGAVQREIDVRRPLCVISGRCCRFEEYGHRLFVTTMELASFVHELHASAVDRRKRMAEWDGTGCPFQVNKLCTVHAFRPFGCRMFFCDATSTEWQNEQYERFHSELKELHQGLGVPYFYVEWKAALKELAPAPDDPD